MIQTTTIQGKQIHIHLPKLRAEMRDIEKRIEASKLILRAPHNDASQQQALHTTKLRPTATFLYTLRAHLRGKSHGRLSLEDRENLLAWWLKSAGPYRQDFTHLIASDEEVEKERAENEEARARYEASKVRLEFTTATSWENSIQAFEAVS